MGFKEMPETEQAIAQTVDALMTCPKSREEALIRKLRNLWHRRATELAARRAQSGPRTRTTGPIPATGASTPAPTESDTAITSTDATDAANETIFP